MWITRIRTVDAEDLKVGDIFWDKKDDRFYTVARLEFIPTKYDDNDIGIFTTQPNSRKGGRIRKARLTKMKVKKED